MKVSVIYEGLTSQSRQTIEMMCNGEFQDKITEDALDCLKIQSIRTLLVLMSHQINLSHLHLVDTCITLGKTMTFKLNFIFS